MRSHCCSFCCAKAIGIVVHVAGTVEDGLYAYDCAAIRSLLADRDVYATDGMRNIALVPQLSLIHTG